MCKSLLLLFSLALLVFAGMVRAGDTMSPVVADLVARAESRQLEKNRIWLKLLGNKSTSGEVYESGILSRDFFLAEDGARNSQAELRATLSAFFDPVGVDANIHPQCRFPARFYWLKTELGFPESRLPEVKCDALEAWADFENLESVSLVMVSGYFGNPASTFGHNLIKLNNGRLHGTGNLLDLSVTYGAAVPKNEPVPVYILKGLFGGYVGSFSDKTFYTQDTLYREIQFRDMWEYELELSEYQKNLMVFHLWELLGKEYTYYFLKENCGYRVAELLELVTGEDLIRDRQPWFLPVDVFHGLNEIHRKKGAAIIRDIKFIPSAQKRLYKGFGRLGDEQAKAVNSVIAQRRVFDGKVFDGFSVSDRIRMSDVLLTYYQYRLVEFEDDPPAYLRDNKDAILRYRLTLPVSRGAPKSVGLQAPPASGSRASLIMFGSGYQEGDGVFARFGFAAVSYDILGIQSGGLENSELKIIDLRFNLSQSEGIYLDYADLVSIEKINTQDTKLYGESNLSWRVSAGLQRRDLACIDCQTLHAGGGVGRAMRIADPMTGYVMLDMNLRSASETVSVTPVLGVIFKGGAFKSVAEVGSRIDRDNRDGDTVIKFDSRYAFSKKNQIRMGFERYRASEFSFGFFHYW